MISSINMNSSWLNLSAMNDFKLSQALANRSGTAVTPVSPIKQTASSLNADSSEFLKEYRNHMTSLQKLSQELTNAVTSGTGVTSSDRSVLTASALYPSGSNASYSVQVKQTANEQVNLTASVRADAAPTAGGSFRLETVNGTYGFEVDSSQASSNRALFGAIADEINRLETGVTAQVVEDGGLVSLALTGNQTGAENAFSVSGDFAVSTGLSTVALEAQDAVYTVDKQGDSLGATEYTSASNKVTIAGRIEANLNKTGTAQIGAGVDPEAVAQKLGGLIKEYNNTLAFLDKNSDRGIGVLQQQRAMLQPLASTRSLGLAGLSMTGDGSYTFDQNTFIAQMDKNPSLLRDIVGGTNGIAQNVTQAARAGLQTASADLVSNSSPLSASGSSQNSMTGLSYNNDAIRMLSAYSRSGAYNMLNYYAVGAMMNLYA